MYYKDVGQEYVYQRKLRLLGFEQLSYLIFEEGEKNPGNFDEKYLSDSEKIATKKANCWIWRRAIKKFIENETDIPKKYSAYKIVKGIGYWKDLHGLIYEIFVKEKQEVSNSSQG